jgi:3-oxosteroid 1-dehydrogenase
VDESFDVVVMGSGAAGLTAALAAAAQGAQVLVLEKSPLLGGTTAISGGQVWIPNNRFLAPAGDSREAASTYLAAVTLGEVDAGPIETFVRAAPEVIADVERLSPLRFFQVERFDYHSEWRGAAWGRSLEPLPSDLRELGAVAALVRRSPYRLAITSAEARAGKGADLDAQRKRAGQVTQGVALVAGLLRGCMRLGVSIRTSSPVIAAARLEDGMLAVKVGRPAEPQRIRARALVIGCGGFEWNQQLTQAFLPRVPAGAASPPWNEGDGLRIALTAGAAVANMVQAWWSAAFSVPGESYDGRPLVRNIVRELALPGSILVNEDGRRFANEAGSYNTLGKAFLHFDPERNKYVNQRAWLVFDEHFKRNYTVATVPATAAAPAWFIRGDSPQQLAASAGIDPGGLEETFARFNAMAEVGHDDEFLRGDARHDHYHGDATRIHPNLAPLRRPPFYALPIFLANLGTKGGVKTDPDGRMLAMDGTALPGFFACGNAAASWMGPGYPGAGGSLGPIMTSAYLCGLAAAGTAARTSNPNRLQHGQR